MKNDRPNPELWELRPGDLPPERALRREPRLRDLQSNPVFRYILYRRRRNSAGRHGGLIRNISILIVTLLMLTRGKAGLGEAVIAAIPYLDLVLAYFVLNPGALRRRSMATRGRFILGIEESMTMDLLQAATPASTFAVGLWGATVRPSNLLMIRLFMIISLILFWVGLDVWTTFGGGRLISFVVVLTILGSAAVGYQLSLMQFSPFHETPRAAQAIALARWRAEFRPQLLRAIRRLYFRAIVVAVMAILILGVVVLAIERRNWIYRALPFDASALLNSDLGLYVGGLVALIVGAALGFFRGRYVRRHADRYLGRLTEDMDFLLHRLWTRSVARRDDPRNTAP